MPAPPDAESTAATEAASGARFAGMRRYVSAYARLIRRHLSDSWFDLAVVVGATFVAAMAQGSAIGFVMLFGRLMDQAAKGETEATGLLRPDGRSIFLVSGALVALLLTSAGFRYLGAVRGRRVARRCHEETTETVFRVFGQIPMLPTDTAWDAKRIRRAAVRAPRLTGYALATLIDLVHPVIHIVVFLGLMLKLDLTATLILVPILLLPSPLLYRLNAHVRDTARQFYDRGELSFGTELTSLFKSLNSGNLYMERSAEAATETVRTSDVLSEHLSTLDHLKLATSRATLVTSVFRPIFLVVILLVLGFRALSDPVAWPTLIAYIVLVGQFVNHCQSLATSGALLTRYYTQLVELQAFEDYVESVRPRLEEDSGPLRECLVTPMNVPPGADDTLVVGPGSVIQYVNPVELGRVTLGRLLAPLRAASRPTIPWRGARFVARGWRPPAIPLGELLAGHPPDDDERRRLATLLNELDLPDLVAALDREDDAAAVADLDPDLLGLLAILPELDRGLLIVLDGRLARRIPIATVRGVLARASSSAVLIAFDDLESTCAAAAHVIAVREDTVDAVGSMTWWSEGEYASTLAAATDSEEIDLLEELELEAG